MSKIGAVKKVGIPVPAVVPSDAKSLNVYYGLKGFTPAYDQAARIALVLASVPTQVVAGASYWVFDSALLPASTAEGNYDLVFTLGDGNNEGDFSPPVTIPLDRTPPAALGQPIVLG